MYVYALNIQQGGYVRIISLIIIIIIIIVNKFLWIKLDSFWRKCSVYNHQQQTKSWITWQIWG